MKRSRSECDIPSFVNKAAKIGNGQDSPNATQNTSPVEVTDSSGTILNETAAHHTDVQDVEELKCSSTEVNQTHSDLTPLLVAAENSVPLIFQDESGATAKLRCKKCIKIILKCYVVVDEYRKLVLITATRDGQVINLKPFLTCKPDPKIITQMRVIPLMVAVRNGHAKCAKVLLDYHKNRNSDMGNYLNFLLIHAVKHGCAKYLTALLDPCVRSNCNIKSLERLLLAASERGHSACVTVLLSYRADPNLPTGEFYKTPLIAAANNGHPQCVKVLLEKRANPNLIITRHFGTPLCAAAKHGHVECVKHLLHHNANPDLRFNDSCETPLFAAIKYGHTECVKILLDYNANPNCFVPVSFINGEVQAVHLAVYQNDSACIKLLLDKIDLSCPINSPYSIDYLCPLQLAVAHGRHECLKTLLSCGFPVDNSYLRDTGFDEDSDDDSNDDSLALCANETAFSFAARIGDLTSMKILLEHGASVNTICSRFVVGGVSFQDYHYPPIFSALYSVKEGIPEFLIKHGCDISYHREWVPTNECLLFSFRNCDFIMNMLKWGSNPHLLFQKGSVESQKIFLDCLTTDRMVKDQNKILHILGLLLQCTAVTGPVQSSFRAVSAKCQGILGDEYKAQRWNEILKEVNKPSSLKNLCRVKIRQLLILKHGYSSFRAPINHFFIPQMLKKYLLYSELSSGRTGFMK